MSGGAGDYLEGYVKVSRALEKAAHVGKVLGHVVDDGGDPEFTLKPEYSQVLEALQAVQELRRESRFACSGTLTILKKELANCVLKVGPAEEEFQCSLESLNAEDLLEACSHHDEQGEDGVLMLASKGTLALQRAAQPGEKRPRDDVQNHTPSSIPFLSAIHAHIERNLSAGSKKFNLNLYGLRIMEKGQASSAAVGTPNSLGSVEICLPVSFRGGELEVTPTDQEEDAEIEPEVFDFANMSSDVNVLRWAAYDAETVPAVSSVIDGCRVSLIFDIAEKTDSTTKAPPKPSKLTWKHPQGVVDDSVFLGAPNFAQAEPLLPYFANSLREVFDKDEHVFFGLLLQEDYSGTEVDEEALAGIDRMIYDHLEQSGYQDLMLVPVLVSKDKKVIAFANDDIQFICGDIDQSRSFETFGLIEDDSTPFVGTLGSRLPVNGCQIIAQALVVNLATYDEDHHAGEEDDAEEEEEAEVQEDHEEDYDEDDMDGPEEEINVEDEGDEEEEEEGEEEMDEGDENANEDFDEDAGEDDEGEEDQDEEEEEVIDDDEEEEEGDE